MDEAEGVEEQGAGRSDSRRERTYRITGLADLLPDCILPPEGKQHVRNARREALLAARSVLDAWIERMEHGTTVRRTPTKIEIE
jgi:hypothetical protein